MYLSLTTPEDDVEVFDAAQRPVDFPATASYISATSSPVRRAGHSEVSRGRRRRPKAISTSPTPEKAWSTSSTRAATFAPRSAFSGSGARSRADPTNGNMLIGTAAKSSSTTPSGNLLDSDQRHGAPARQSAGLPRISDRPGGRHLTRPTRSIPASPTSRSPNPPRPLGLKATVDPNGGGEGHQLSVRIRHGRSYGTIGALRPRSASSPPGSNFAAPTPVSAAISGLAPETTYHYRVVVRKRQRHQVRRRPDLHAGKVLGPDDRRRDEPERRQRDPQRLVRRRRKRHPLLLRMGSDRPPTATPPPLRRARTPARRGPVAHLDLDRTHRPRPVQHLPLPGGRGQRLRHQPRARIGYFTTTPGVADRAGRGGHRSALGSRAASTAKSTRTAPTRRRTSNTSTTPTSSRAAGPDASHRPA